MGLKAVVTPLCWKHVSALEAIDTHSKQDRPTNVYVKVGQVMIEVRLAGIGATALQASS